MSHSGHEIIQCSCGAVIAQCRCFDRNKRVVVVPNGCADCKKKEAVRTTSTD